MEKKQSVVKGVLTYSISTWVNLVISMLSIILMTRLLKPDAYGIVMMFLSASNVMLYILTLGFDGAYVRFYNEPPRNDTQKQLLFKNLFYTISFSLLVGIVVSLLWGNNLSLFIFNISNEYLIYCLFAYTFSQLILRFLNISYRMSFQSTKYNIQNIVLNCMARIIIITAAFLTKNIIIIITTLSITFFSITCIYLYSQKAEFLPQLNNKKKCSISLVGYSDYIKFALYSAPTYIVSYLNTYAGQQIIMSKYDAFSVGLFASTGAFASIINSVRGGFSTYWSAYVYKFYSSEKEKITNMHDYIMLISIILTFLLVTCRDIIYILIGTEFHAGKLFFSLLLTMPILSLILETTNKGIALAKKNQYLLLTHATAAILNIFLSYLFVNIYGIEGVAFANFLSAIFLFVVNSYLGQKYFRTIYNIYKTVVGVIIILFMLLFPTVITNILYIIFFSFFCLVLSLFVYYKEAKNIFILIQSYLSIKK